MVLICKILIDVKKNLSLYRNALSEEEMIKLTKSDACTVHPPSPTAELYLGWNEMQWNMDGEVRESTISTEELCYVPEESHFLLLNGCY